MKQNISIERKNGGYDIKMRFGDKDKEKLCVTWSEAVKISMDWFEAVEKEEG